MQRLPLCEALAHPLQTGLKVRLIDRLQQVIDRLRINGLQRVLAERRDKNDQGCQMPRQLLYYLESSHARHLDVQKQQIRLPLHNRRKRITTVRAFAEHVKIRRTREP